MRLVPLSDKDRQEIKSSMIPKAACFAIVGGYCLIRGMGGAIHPALRSEPVLFMANSVDDIISLGLPSLAFTIIIGYLAYRIINRKRIRTLKAGKKRARRVIMQDKETYHYGYYLIIAGERHKVDEATFNSANAGDCIEMHYTPEDTLGFYPVENQISK